MKKYFSFFCYVAMAIAAVSFVSCGDDDEIDEPKQEEQKPQMVNIYAASYGVNVLDIYDVTLKIYRNGKKQDVVLSTSNSSKAHDNDNNRDYYTYYCASVNGEEGVDSVAAVVTAKSNIEAVIASKNADSYCDLSCRTLIKEVNKAANGDYSNRCERPNFSRDLWGDLMAEDEVYEKYGKYQYELRRSNIEDRFSAK